MNPEQLFAHVKKLASTLTPGQIAGLVAVFLAVVGIVAGSAYWMSIPQYTLLMADMDPDTAAAVTAKLDADRVTYELVDGGRAIRVPTEQADKLRLELASTGVAGGRIGYEIFDRTAFGTTEFQEQINYQRALEGELGRTIATLKEVSSARVHITMAEDSLFVGNHQPAKASVVLSLYNNRPLAESTARGIAGLVAGSVPELRPEAVVILDTTGRALLRMDDDTTGLGNSSLERQQEIEKDLTQRVVALLEPVVGAGRVRVNVSAQLQHDRVEQTEEQYSPDSVVRSRQTSVETGGAGSPAGGVAGARANQPPDLSTSTAADPDTTPAVAASDAATAAVAAGSLPGRTSETTNYEISRVTRHTVRPEGEIARLSVAVVLDNERVVTTADDGSTTVDSQPWAPEQIARFQGIVAASVGLDPNRGDVLTIENVGFGVPEAPVPLDEPSMINTLTDVGLQYWPMALRWVGILAIVGFAFFGVLRPLTTRLGAVAPAAALPTPQQQANARLATVSEMESQIEAELDASSAQQSRRLPVLQRRVGKIASEEPEQLANIVRSWIAEEDR